jgi:predicted transcriptional regulator
MYLSPLERDILIALRHGPLDHFQIAADTQSAPFMVRASLKRLKGARAVRENLDWRKGHHWELTPRGHAAIEHAQQLVLGGDL